MLNNKAHYVSLFADILCEASDDNCENHEMLIEAFQEAIDTWLTYHSASLQRFKELKSMSDDIV